MVHGDHLHLATAHQRFQGAKLGLAQPVVELQLAKPEPQGLPGDGLTGEFRLPEGEVGGRQCEHVASREQVQGWTLPFHTPVGAHKGEPVPVAPDVVPGSSSRESVARPAGAGPAMLPNRRRSLDPENLGGVGKTDTCLGEDANVTAGFRLLGEGSSGHLRRCESEGWPFCF